MSDSRVYTRRLRVKSEITTKEFEIRQFLLLKEEICSVLYKLKLYPKYEDYFLRCNVKPEAVRLVIAMMQCDLYSTGFWYEMLNKAINFTANPLVSPDDLIDAVNLLITCGFIKFDHVSKDRVFLRPGRNSLELIIQNGAEG